MSDLPETGLPRPFVSYPRPTARFPMKKLPVPWLNWKKARDEKDWMSFDLDAERILHEHDCLLCAVCGDELGETKIFGALYGDEWTSGSAMHPKCAVIAYAYCPHLRHHGEERAFLIYRGPDHGLKIGFETGASGLPDLSEVLVADGTTPITLAEVKQLAKDEAAEGRCPVSAGECPVAHS